MVEDPVAPMADDSPDNSLSEEFRANVQQKLKDGNLCYIPNKSAENGSFILAEMARKATTDFLAYIDVDSIDVWNHDVFSALADASHRNVRVLLVLTQDSPTIRSYASELQDFRGKILVDNSPTEHQVIMPFAVIDGVDVRLELREGAAPLLVIGEHDLGAASRRFILSIARVQGEAI